MRPLPQHTLDTGVSTPFFSYESEYSRVIVQKLTDEYQRTMGLREINFASTELEPNAMSLSLPFHKKGRGLRTSRDTKFLKDVRQIVLHRFVAESEGHGNFLIGLAFGDQRHHSFFLR